MKREYSNKQIKSTEESQERVENKPRYFMPEHSRSVEAESAQDAEKIINQTLNKK